MAGISYALLIDGQPASPGLLDAVQQIEVEDHADMADMLRMRLAVAVRDDGSGWAVLDEDVLYRLARIRIMVSIGDGRVEPLVEAHVIETAADFANQPGQSAVNVVAMDPTVLMNLEEKVRPWPDMADSVIATTLFDEYGFEPQVEQTRPARQQVDITTIQRGTDIQFLQELAERNGYEVYVEINPSNGGLEGHFHPPRLEQKPQGVLSVNMGLATNVNSFNARFDMLRPTTARVTGVDVETHSEQPSQAESPSLVQQGSKGVLGGERQRTVLLSRTGLAQTAELQPLAQAVVDRSAWAISADGELHTVAYGGILRAKRLVEVRGAGRQFSGTYYVERVLHTISGDGYTQHFTLRRNALALTGRERFADDAALPVQA